MNMNILCIKTLLTTDYVYWLVVVSGIFILFIIISIIVRSCQKRRIFTALATYCRKKGYTFKACSKQSYDYHIQADGKQIFIKTVFVPIPAAITINSKDTWNLTYGGRGRPGKSYPRQRYLTELRPFLTKELPGVKLVIIYPSIDKVQRYLNESEIAILNGDEHAYGIKFIIFERWIKHLSDLI